MLYEVVHKHPREIEREASENRHKVKFIDRRRDEPEPSAEDIAERETARLARRARTRQSLAAAELAERRWHEIGADIEAVDERKERLADEHVARVAPLQRELKQLEDHSIDLIAARQPVPADVDSRRREVIGQIQRAAAELESDLAAEDALIGRLEGERIKVAAEAGRAGEFRGNLFKSGRPDLLLAHACAESALDWASARCRAISDRQMKTGDGFRLVTGEILAAERSAAGKARTDAAAEVDRLYSQIINE